MYLNFIAYALVGKLLLFLWHKAPYQKWFTGLPKVGKFFGELFECDLCLGVWVYFLLDFLFHINLLEVALLPVLLEFLTGCLTSFIVWIFTAGWNTLFRNIVIGE